MCKRAKVVNVKPQFKNEISSIPKKKKIIICSLFSQFDKVTLHILCEYFFTAH